MQRSTTKRARAFGRRALLGGAAALGATIGLPWLELRAGRGHAQVATPPKRFVLISTGHGPHAVTSSGRPDWIPNAAGPIASLPPLLTPLADYRDRLTTVSGVDNLVRSRLAGDAHITASMAVLTCQPHQEAVSGDTITRAEITFSSSNAAGPSIDYAMANALGARPLTLRVGALEAQSRRCFDTSRNEDPGEPNPMRAFDRLFAAVAPPEPMVRTPREQLLRRRRDLLGAVRESYRSMAGRLGAEDRLRMEAHAELVSGFQAELDETVEVVCTNPSIPAPPGETRFEDWNGRQDDLIASTQNSLIATALACRATQVASLHYSTFSENAFPFINGGADMPFHVNWHETVHGNDPDELRLRPMQWYFAMVADLLRKLEAVPEGDGTLLDNTIVVWTSSLADQFHGDRDMPLVVVSGANSGLARGHHDLGGARRSLGDFWTTMLHAMGVPASTFGWARGETEGRPFCSGPIEALLDA